MEKEVQESRCTARRDLPAHSGVLQVPRSARIERANLRAAAPRDGTYERLAIRFAPCRVFGGSRRDEPARGPGPAPRGR